jgi:hypothetical protein
VKNESDLSNSCASLDKIERRHGFPCEMCGAQTFEEAGDKCRGLKWCPGETMSNEVFEKHNKELNGTE